MLSLHAGGKDQLCLKAFAQCITHLMQNLSCMHIHMYFFLLMEHNFLNDRNNFIFYILNQALAKIFITIFIPAGCVEKYFSCDCTELLHTARYPHLVTLNLRGSGFGFLFVFYILSKLPHLFQASECFSTQQCPDCQYQITVPQHNIKTRNSEHIPPRISSCSVQSILIFTEQCLFVIARYLSDS